MVTLVGSNCVRKTTSIKTNIKDISFVTVTNMFVKDITFRINVKRYEFRVLFYTI